MTTESQTEKDKIQATAQIQTEQASESEEVLCPHCQRTATNGIKCQGICVSDSNY